MSSMARFEHKEKDEVGRSPDDMTFHGEQKMDSVLLRVIDYDGSSVTIQRPAGNSDRAT